MAGIMKLLKKKWYWLLVAQFMLVTIYFGVLHVHPFQLELLNLKAAVFGTVPKEVYYSPRPTVVNTWNQNFSINGQNICKQMEPYLLLLVLSIPENVEMRDAIRDTWTKTENWPNFKSSMTIKTVFLFGQYKDNKANSLLVDENAKHGDIVVGNFVEGYRNLTIKVLTGLSWVRRYCAGASFVAKMDDDTFINIPLLYKQLQAIPQLNYTILGYLVRRGPPERYGKYYVSYISFPFRYYPPYTTGNMYIARPETFFALLDVAPYLPRIEMEDVYITGILAKVAKVRHWAVPPGMYFPRKLAAACEFVNNTKLYSKDYSSKSVREAMKRIKDPREKCK